MNEQTQNEQSEGIVPSPPNEQPPESPPARKFKLNRKFVIGFLGWYLVTALVFGVVTLDAYSNGCIIFPAQVLTLIILLSVRTVRDIGWGMLSAIAFNLLISLMVGLGDDAICFVPFFYDI